MISQASPLTSLVNCTKIVDFARNSVFERQTAKNLFQHFIIVYFKKEVSCVHIWGAYFVKYAF